MNVLKVLISIRDHKDVISTISVLASQKIIGNLSDKKKEENNMDGKNSKNGRTSTKDGHKNSDGPKYLNRKLQ